MLHLQSCYNSRVVKNSRNRISLTLFLETQSSEVEKANGIKRHLCKLTQETQDSWFKVLPVTLMRTWIATKKVFSLWQTAFMHRSWSFKINYVTQLLAFQHTLPGGWLLTQPLSQTSYYLSQEPRWAWESTWACFCWLQKLWVCRLTLKTATSCPGLIPMVHSTIGLIAGSAEHSPPHQLKTSHGGFLCLKKRTFFNSVMTSNNPKMDWCNYGHNVTFNFDYVLTWFNGYFALHL